MELIVPEWIAPVEPAATVLPITRSPSTTSASSRAARAAGAPAWPDARGHRPARPPADPGPGQPAYPCGDDAAARRGRRPAARALAARSGSGRSSGADVARVRPRRRRAGLPEMLLRRHHLLQRHVFLSRADRRGGAGRWACGPHGRHHRGRLPAPPTAAARPTTCARAWRCATRCATNRWSASRWRRTRRTRSRTTASGGSRACRRGTRPCRSTCHVHETLTRDRARASPSTASGRSQRLADLGLLGPRFHRGPRGASDRRRIWLLAARRRVVAHCPHSNLKLASGIAPVGADADRRGPSASAPMARPATTASTCWPRLRTAASLLAKGSSGDATAWPAHETLHAMTLAGARALGLGDQLGSITAGKQADLVAIDLSEARTLPVFEPVAQLVYGAGSDQVTTVWGRRQGCCSRTTTGRPASRVAARRGSGTYPPMAQSNCRDSAGRAAPFWCLKRCGSASCHGIVLPRGET
jgi:hypothetical protein